MTKFKNNHYLSQFYLKGFMCNKKGTYFWDIKRQPKGKIDYKNNYRTISKIGYENYLFCFKKDDETYDKSLEIEFSKKENDYKKIFEEIIQSVNSIINGSNINGYQLTLDEKLLFVDFIRFQFQRSIVIQDGLGETLESKVENEIEKLYKIQFISKERYELLVKYLKENKDKHIHNTRLEMIKMLLCDETYFKKIMGNKNLYIFYTNRRNKSFITSDFPIYRHNNNGKNGIIHNETQIVFPVSSNIVILLYQEGNKQIYQCENNDIFINKVNGMILANADNLIVSKDFELLKEMVKWKLNGSDFLYPKNLYVEEIEKKL